MWKDDDDEPFGERAPRFCFDCKVVAPKTDTNYTLVSAKYNWRLTRTFDAEGKIAVELRCPACWERYKLRRQIEQGGPPSGRSVTPPPSRASATMPAATPSRPSSTMNAVRPSPPPPRAPSGTLPATRPSQFPPAGTPPSEPPNSRKK